MTEFDFTETRGVLTGALIEMGADEQTALKLANGQVQALASNALAVVPFYTKGPEQADERLMRSLVTAMVAEMPDQATAVLGEVSNPYGAVMVCAGIIAATIITVAEREGVEPAVVWQQVCTIAELDPELGHGE